MGKNAADTLTAGMMRDCRTRSTPAVYWPASAGPTRYAMMNRSITLDIASSVSEMVSGMPAFARPASRAPSKRMAVPRQASRVTASAATR